MVIGDFYATFKVMPTNKIPSFQTPKNGFTLIEILVVIGIMAIIVIVGIPNLRKLGENQKLSHTSSESIRMLKEGQSRGMGRIKCPTGDVTQTTSWTVRFNRSVNTITIGCQVSSADITVLPTPTAAETITVDSTITISSSCGSGDPAVVFRGNTTSFFCGTLVTPSNTMSINFAKDGTTKTVTVDTGGVISAN